jgi:pilus assembly protein Flp/PilA
MVTKLLNFFKEEEGATAVEYGIMVAAIAAVIITVVILVGGETNNAFQKVADQMPLASGGGS